MTARRLRRLGGILLMAITATGIVACGGGGGNGAGTPPTTTSTGTSSTGTSTTGTPATGSSTVTTLSASSNAVSVTVSPTASDPNPSINLAIANPPSAGLFYSYATLGSAVQTINLSWDSALTNGAQDGSLTLQLYSPGLMGSGSYHDTVTLQVCSDSKCATQIAGSPVTIAVTYTVTGNVVSDASYAISPTSFNLEAPSNGLAPAATVAVTAYEVPPYGAYVFAKSQSGGVASNTTFTATTAPNDFGEGTLTINLPTPSTLGPGVYNDVISLSICYDDACTKPAIGSPWQIPVTYTVTASAGREFQQQIVDVNFTALTVDSTGAFLYGAVEADVNSNTAAELVKIDPTTATVTPLLAIDADIDQVVASGDGRYLYLASAAYSSPGNTPYHVIRVNTSTMLVDFTVYPTAVAIGPMTVAVSPLSSNIWSLAFLNQTTFGSPTAFTAQVFDGNVARPNTWSISSDNIYANQAQWSSDGATLYVRDLNLNAVSVGTNGLGAGVQLLAPPDGSTPGVGAPTLLQAGGLLYGDGDSVLDPASDTILGKYSLQTPSSEASAALLSLAVDVTNNRTFAAYEDSTPASTLGTLQSFNRTQFSSIWIARLPVSGGLVRWGTNGLAFMGASPSTAGQSAVYLINGTFVAPAAQ